MLGFLLLLHDVVCSAPDWDLPLLVMLALPSLIIANSCGAPLP